MGTVAHGYFNSFQWLGFKVVNLGFGLKETFVTLVFKCCNIGLQPSFVIFINEFKKI